MKTAPTLSLAALFAAAALAGCTTKETTSYSGLDKQQKIVMKQMPYKAGSGVVESWAAAPNPAAAATGASGRVDPSAGGTLRLGIKMSDGSMQYVDTDSRDFPIGTRVELTPDRIIRRTG